MNNYKRIRISNILSKDNHRLVMEKYLGRKLLSSEIVHHKDGNKSNDNINNLQLTTRIEHIKIHIKDLYVFTKNDNIKSRYSQFGYTRKKLLGDKYECTKCKEIKHSSKFNKQLKTWNKLYPSCKICKRKSDKICKDKAKMPE